MPDSLAEARTALFDRDLPDEARTKALWALIQGLPPEELLALVAVVLRSADLPLELRRDAAFSLGRISHPGVREVLEPLLDASEPELRGGAICSLNNERELFPRLVAALSDPAPLVRDWAGDAVGWQLHACGDEGVIEIDRASALEPLLRCLEDEDVNVRQSAAYALSYLDDPRVVEPLAAHLGDPDEYARSRVVFALASHGDARALPVGLALLTSTTLVARELVVDALAQLPGHGARRALQRMLRGGDSPIIAARALGLLGDRKAISSLKRAAITRDRRLRKAARRAICRLRGG